LNYQIKDLIVAREDNRPISIGEGTKIGDVPYFTDGAIIVVNSRAPKKEVMHSGIKTSDLEYLPRDIGTTLWPRSATIRLEESA
jgi:hypothetical protein